MTLPLLAVAWLCGIYLASLLQVPRVLLCLATIIPLAMTLFWWREPRVRLGAASALFLVLGSLRYEMALPSFDESHLAYYNGCDDVTVTGVVVEEPIVHDRYVNLTVTSRALDLDYERRGVTGLVLVQTGRYPALSYGDELRVEGDLQTPPEYEDFSYREYLARQGIHSMIRHGEVTLLSPGHGDAFHRAVYSLRGHLQATIPHLFPEPSASLLSGILLGIETGIPDSVMEDFNATSTTHIIAISGFNIAVVAGAIAVVTKGFVGLYKSSLISIVAVILYTLFVGADPAVVRAAIMGSLALFAIIAGRQTFALASLALAALLMTFWSPMLLWDIGFELSFAATLGLILLVRPMEQGFRALLSRLRSEEQAAFIVRLLSEPLFVTTAAQLAVWPITVYYFHRLSLISPVANFLIIPAQPAVMMWGGLATILGALHPNLGQPVAWLAWLFLAYTIRVVKLTARIPFANFELGGFSAGLMWTYYGLFALSAVGARVNRARLREMWRQASAGLSGKLAIGALALLVILAWITAQQMPDGRLHVHFFDVGQGDAIFIECPEGQQILVDGGPLPSAVLSELGRHMPFWDHSLDLVVLTHPEDDHITGLVDVLARYDVAQVLVSGQGCDTAICEAWRQLIEEKEIPYRRAAAGLSINVGEEAWLYVLHPPATLLADTSSDANNNSIVLRLEYGRFSALLTGDIEHEGERALLASGQPVDSLVLKVPHHGAESALSLPFVQAVDPQLAIISVGAENRFGHPGEFTLEKLQDVDTYRTDQHGNVEVVTDGESYWVSGER